jgi:hypothetical protein
MYRDIQDDVLSSLTSLAETHSLDAKGLASKLDRFMTVSRYGWAKYLKYWRDRDCQQ